MVMKKKSKIWGEIFPAFFCETFKNTSFPQKIHISPQKLISFRGKSFWGFAEKIIKNSEANQGRKSNEKPWLLVAKKRRCNPSVEKFLT